MISNNFKRMLLTGACAALTATPVAAVQFDIPGGDLKTALDAYAKQAGVSLIVSADAVCGARTDGIKADISADAALSRILTGTGFTMRKDSGAIVVLHNRSSEVEEPMPVQLAQSVGRSGGSIETVTVTSSKLGAGDVQNVPIAITAMSQEQLTATQTTGGPDLVRQIPNFNFTKTNFSGYSIQIRGIGTQAVSVTTDPAVAVAFNDTAFIRNHFFEQEFYDVAQVEVLRGPQGTLYGRNATAGVVNIVSARPSDQYEAQASVDVGNYNNRRLEGMLNIPVIGDKLDIRLAGEWTKRDGYDFNTTTQHAVNGRDLWSSRFTVGFKPIEKLQGYVIWEHFSEDDNRSRTGKQLCHRDPGVSQLGDFALDIAAAGHLSQGCKPGSMYDAGAFGTPNGLSIPFIQVASDPSFLGLDGSGLTPVKPFTDPYGGMMQSSNLREIASIKDPKFRARNDTVELNFDYQVTPSLTFTSQSGYSKDLYYSTQDYNRFNTVPIFADTSNLAPPMQGLIPGGIYCDPQLGCSNSLVGFDISQAKSTQFNQEVRLQSNFEGPLNFSVGANYSHYKTVEDYYVLYNLITLVAQSGGLNTLFNSNSDITKCAPKRGSFNGHPIGFGNPDVPPVTIGTPESVGCLYIDPNPLDKINGEGHNYFRSDNPYHLSSAAIFGEAYWQATTDLKIIAGVRYTDDHKTFTPVPTQVLLTSAWFGAGTVDRGYPALPDIKQSWGQFTGRLGAQWSPKLSWTDQTMFYATYSRGYKGGGANPPGIGYSKEDFIGQPTAQALPYPPIFKPEFVNAFEGGAKNTLLDGSLTLNADTFFYDYKNYQISQIKSRTAVNENFDAKVWGAELEATWEPVAGLRFNFAGGYEGSRVDDNQFSLDLMNRTQGDPDLLLVRPYVLIPDSCVVPRAAALQTLVDNGNSYATLNMMCGGILALKSNILNGPNGGAGVFANVGGNELPNTPPFTLSLGAQYSMPLSTDWIGTLRGDGYWQGASFGRIYNEKPYDQIHAYTNLNLTLIFTNQDGWQAMAYVKNVFDTTAITGTFLNSDDSALTTNIFTTDPRLFGIRITKNW